MASSSSSNLPPLFILVILISIFSLPVLHARDMQFFSKASHTTTTGNQPATTTNNEPSISTSEQAMDDQQGGYGLYGHGNNADEQETYQYSPTTLNPTVAAGKRSTNNNNNDAFQMDSYSSVNEGGNIGNRWTGQGVSDRTRKADDGSFETEKMMNEQQRQPRFSAEGEIERGSHGEIYYNNKINKQQSGGGDALRKSFYGTVDRQGMSDTRYLENGKYYYDVSSDEEKMKKYDDNTITNSRGFDNTDDNDDNEAVSYEAEDVDDNDEEEDGHDRIYQYENNKYSHDGKQGMSDTRYIANGRYFYDINKEKEQVNNKYNDNEEVLQQQQQGFENDKSNNRKSNEYHHTVNQNENRGEQDGYKSNAARFDFRNTVNKFPKYEFDSMEEYMKQNGYNP